MSGLEKTDVKLGFIPLTDCAPLIVAQELGLFEAEGLSVTLTREASWANIRDKVTVGALDGAHMLAPMALASSLGAGGPATPMIAPLSLNANGSSVTVSTDLARRLKAIDPEGCAARPRRARALKQLIDLRAAAGEPPLTFAVVFPFSIHNYLLRYWLAEAGVDPDRDVRLQVVPPPRMAARLASGQVDGFCVGAPWGAFVEAARVGEMVMLGSEFCRGAPDKVLGLTAAWAAQRPETLQALLRALIRAAAWSDEPANRPALAALLARKDFVDAPESVVRPALTDSPAVGLRFHQDGAGYPNPAHALWLLTQMRRWGQIDRKAKLPATADAVYRPDLYRQAAGAAGLPPADDAAGASLTFYDGGVFDPSKVEDYMARFPIRRPQAPA